MYPEALIIEPMKINKIPKGKEDIFPSLCESGEYFAQLKKDGYNSATHGQAQKVVNMTFKYLYCLPDATTTYNEYFE